MTAPVPDVHVIRSAKRRKTVSARVVGDRIEVRVPAWMSEADTVRYVADLVAKIERRHRADALDLAERAHTLARRYRLPRPSSVGWTDRDRSRWGWCNVRSGEIVVSRRLASYPPWVLDYVLVHELAHLVERRHDASFWALVNRYPKTERARGYLIAKSGDTDEALDPEPADVLEGDPVPDVAASPIEPEQPSPRPSQASLWS